MGRHFFDDDDSLLKTLAQKKKNKGYWLYGYCLMNIHVGKTKIWDLVHESD
jgi:hypothetical protein